jgi:hypothetical protein
MPANHAHGSAADGYGYRLDPYKTDDLTLARLMAIQHELLAHARAIARAITERMRMLAPESVLDPPAHRSGPVLYLSPDGGTVKNPPHPPPPDS